MELKPIKNKKHFLSKETGAFFILTILLISVLVKYVDLTPYVDNNFFFSSEDPHYQADNEISKLFTRKDSQIIISVTGDIFSSDYKNKIRQFSDLLLTFDNVTGVKSITRGPNNINDAIKSPFWRRLLVSKDRKSTNVIVILEELATKDLIPKIENLTSVLRAEDFQIRISGFPYIAELIRRNLQKDLEVFSLLALLFFGIVVAFIFHSWRILLGMIVSCATACSLTFMITHLLEIKIGILTANLATIIFILTLSHIVFLTFNWKNIHQPNSPHYSSVDEAIKITCPASFWSMVTTLFGFLSILFVPAKPLRELGISGAMGTLIAFIVAYSIYPSFLRLKESSHLRLDRSIKHYFHVLFSIVEKRRFLVVICVLALMIVTLPSLRHIDADPSLIAYFAKDSEIAEGLEYIDRNGGSNPLVIVLKTKSGETLNTNKVYRQLWKLQRDLENHSDVGTIISLPTLMAEGKRSHFGFFLIWEWYLEALEKPQYDRIARSFITEDRRYGLFLLRMNELNRTSNRLEVIDELKQIINAQNFTPHLVGGIYALQGHLSNLVVYSLIYGLGRLIILFTIIAFVISRSLRIALAMTLSIGIIPVCILGGIGFLGIPLDIIAAPAANVAISMGIDAMIHMVHAYHRLSDPKMSDSKNWIIVRKQMWEPIITSMFIVSAGFGIFFFSSFPPTQRFGGSIVLGTIIAALSALYIFPLIAEKKNI
jgi:uncharacterized protein